ncbi:MAG: membrane dipeptidase [Pseudomonadales bacterium]|nr:membrane dipeptidase [Pseudomonadales bacterium]
MARLSGLLLMLTLVLQGCVTTEQIHRDAIVIDAHADIEIPGKESRYVGADGRSKVEPEKMRRGGVDVVVMAIAVGPGPRTADGDAEAKQQADAELAAIQRMTADDDNLNLAHSVDEIKAAHQQGKQSYILGFQNARILGGDINLLDHYYEQGVRVFALTHMGHNDFADSSRPTFIRETGQHEPAEEHGGLSEAGRQAIQRLNKLGAVVDISQLSKRASMQAISMSTAPVIASHSDVQALCGVSRNLSDEEIDLIGANGGVIHVTPFRGYLFDSGDVQLDKAIREARRIAGIKEDYLYPFELYWELDDEQVQQTFLQTVSELLGPGRLDDMMAHLDYIVNRIGIDHVGIGTDFNHGGGIEGFNDASEAQNVTAALRARGYTQEEINKIWGGNFLRVMQAAQDQAQ